MVDARRLKRLCAPRDNLRINPVPLFIENASLIDECEVNGGDDTESITDWGSINGEDEDDAPVCLSYDASVIVVDNCVDTLKAFAGLLRDDEKLLAPEAGVTVIATAVLMNGLPSGILGEVKGLGVREECLEAPLYMDSNREGRVGVDISRIVGPISIRGCMVRKRHGHWNHGRRHMKRCAIRVRQGRIGISTDSIEKRVGCVGGRVLCSGVLYGDRNQPIRLRAAAYESMRAAQIGSVQAVMQVP